MADVSLELDEDEFDAKEHGIVASSAVCSDGSA